MGGKKPPPKLSAEEKAAAAVTKANESLAKACKNDERAKAEEALGKGADVMYINDVCACCHEELAWQMLQASRDESCSARAHAIVYR